MDDLLETYVSLTQKLGAVITDNPQQTLRNAQELHMEINAWSIDVEHALSTLLETNDRTKEQDDDLHQLEILRRATLILLKKLSTLMAQDRILIEEKLRLKYAN
jgi:hypothetical protein